MAWDEIEGGGYSGDEPMDIFTGALQRLSDSYLERFGRLPALREVLYAFRLVLYSAPDEYLHDPELLPDPWPPLPEAGELPGPLEG
jgi:hypothetical protein